MARNLKCGARAAAAAYAKPATAQLERVTTVGRFRVGR